MIIPALLILSVLPAVLILFYIYRKNKYEQEPLGLLLKAFGLGMLPCLIIWLVCLILNIAGISGEPGTGNHFFDAFVEAFCMAAIPEELLKFAILYLLVWNNRNFSERFDGIIYSVFVALGFATLENITYVLGYGIGTGIVRAITAVPAHALFGVAMGFYFSYAKFLPEYKNKYLMLAIVIPIVLHGIYDFILMWQEKLLENNVEVAILLTLVFITFVVFLWMQGLKKIKKLSADFYFTGIPANEIQEYINSHTPQYGPQLPVHTISYLRNWYEITPQLLEHEQDLIYEKYPEALVDVDISGIITATLVTACNYQWKIRLTYARNYSKLKEQLRVYVLQPDLNELTAISNEIPYTKIDLSGNYYLDVASELQSSGANAIENALRWIYLFERWVNEEIELKEFVIN
jgi:RsiW-degrading membrane proteinase PrsW (M82 family)